MIILEGTDLVGKTTLAKRLITGINEVIDAKRQDCGIDMRANMRYQHLTVPPAGWDYEHDYLAMCARNVVQDRLWLSERAYGVITRGDTLIFNERLHMLECAARATFGAVTVVILGDDVTIEREFDRLPDSRRELFTLDTIRKVNKQYRALVQCFKDKAATNWMVYDMGFKEQHMYPAENEEFISCLINRWFYAQTHCLAKSWM